MGEVVYKKWYLIEVFQSPLGRKRKIKMKKLKHCPPVLKVHTSYCIHEDWLLFKACINIFQLLLIIYWLICLGLLGCCYDFCMCACGMGSTLIVDKWALKEEGEEEEKMKIGGSGIQQRYMLSSQWSSIVWGSYLGNGWMKWGKGHHRRGTSWSQR